MTTQAISLSLEQQTQHRQRQAQASLEVARDPPPAVTPKPKKSPTPRVEPKQDPEPVVVSLRVRGQGRADGRAWGRSAAGTVGAGAARGAEGEICVVTGLVVGTALIFRLGQEEPPEEDVPDGFWRPKSFQQKRDYFQKMGEDAQGGGFTGWGGGAPCSPESLWSAQEPRLVAQGREGLVGWSSSWVMVSVWGPLQGKSR